MGEPSLKRAHTETDTPTGEVRRNPSYNGPNTDILLLSSDNASFRYSKFMLSLHSSMLKEMFSIPSNETDGETGLPICAPDLTESQLKIFLDIFTEAKAYDAKDANYDELCHIEAYSQQLSVSTRMLNVIRSTKAQRTTLEPWEVFISATRRNDIAVARSAIAQFVNDPILFVNDPILNAEAGSFTRFSRFLEGLREPSRLLKPHVQLELIIAAHKAATKVGKRDAFRFDHAAEFFYNRR